VKERLDADPHRPSRETSSGVSAGEKMYDAWPILFDISRPVTPEIPVWPGDPPFEIGWACRITDGDGANVAAIRMGMHTGTHVDAPRHILEDGHTVDEIDVRAFVGKARLVDARGRSVIDLAFVTEVLAECGEARRILFRTGAWEGANARANSGVRNERNAPAVRTGPDDSGNSGDSRSAGDSGHPGDPNAGNSSVAAAFPTVFPALDAAAAEALVAAGIRLVGTDAPSVDPPESEELPAHHALLRAGIPILENLRLDEPVPGEYELIALPLRIVGADASPVRAVLRTL
jgi:arylformamidase